MRIVFAGTPEFAVPCLDAVLASGHQIVAVYTQPDRPAGRGRALAASPVKQRAIAAVSTLLTGISLVVCLIMVALKKSTPSAG